jgi:hypothetical protein
MYIYSNVSSECNILKNTFEISVYSWGDYRFSNLFKCFIFQCRYSEIYFCFVTRGAFKSRGSVVGIATCYGLDD